MSALTVAVMLLLLCAASYVATGYEMTAASVATLAVKLIAEAEGHTELDGTGKMEYVVRHLVWEIPAIFSKVFTRERLEQLAQEAFNDMKEFARLRRCAS